MAITTFKTTTGHTVHIETDDPATGARRRMSSNGKVEFQKAQVTLEKSLGPLTTVANALAQQISQFDVAPEAVEAKLGLKLSGAKWG